MWNVSFILFTLNEINPMSCVKINLKLTLVVSFENTYKSVYLFVCVCVSDRQSDDRSLMSVKSKGQVNRKQTVHDLSVQITSFAYG